MRRRLIGGVVIVLGDLLAELAHALNDGVLSEQNLANVCVAVILRIMCLGRGHGTLSHRMDN